MICSTCLCQYKYAHTLYKSIQTSPYNLTHIHTYTLHTYTLQFHIYTLKHSLSIMQTISLYNETQLFINILLLFTINILNIFHNRYNNIA